MKLHKVLIEAQENLDAATVEYKLNREDVCLEWLGQIYDLLEDVVGSKARDKSESAESTV